MGRRHGVCARRRCGARGEGAVISSRACRIRSVQARRTAAPLSARPRPAVAAATTVVAPPLAAAAATQAAATLATAAAALSPAPAAAPAAARGQATAAAALAGQLSEGPVVVEALAARRR